jgi:hypothetical protein
VVFSYDDIITKTVEKIKPGTSFSSNEIAIRFSCIKRKPTPRQLANIISRTPGVKYIGPHTWMKV